ncbi:concanavalin A-like lectin/glucanase domain-containing protein [Podospora australis]|uniref:Concanavalin A-like lectin/glucanase domain-containing protein n=1 Tax=Podospora australis TaxID=1536484 RepID=A0AAN6WST4_9PEZI|nr:concanavalin A-like lectin/glucanase domain-containing protein [Podospora australis]
MRWIHAALFGSALLIHNAVAEFKFSVTGTRNGVPIPQNEIKLVPFEFGRSRNTKGAVSPPHRQTKRANPTISSANWCGSVNYTPSSNQIKIVHAYWRHPTCTKRTGVTTYPQAVAAWAGIDGDTWLTALLQSGTVCKIDSATAQVRHEAWWQWVPEAAFTISTMPVNPGDWFEVTINTTSTTAGTITLTNIDRGHTYTIHLTGGPTLGRINADFVVERPYYGGSLASFASFTETWFQDAYAVRTTGSNLGLLGANQYQIPGLCASAEYDNLNGRSWSL